MERGEFAAILAQMSDEELDLLIEILEEIKPGITTPC